MKFDRIPYDSELLSYLQSFLLEERKSRFEKILEQRTRHLTVVLENTSDAHNINAVFRSCEGFGIQDIHVIENGSKFKPAKKILRGSHRWLTVKKYKDEEDNTLNCIHTLRAKGYRIVATTPHHHDLPLHQLKVDQPLALFFGQEHEGVSEIVKAHADDFVIIPMQGFTESFNISAAAAILSYELSHRIRANKEILWQLSEEEKNALRFRWTLQNIYRVELIIRRFYEEQKINSEK
ncbi:RNA methyltransferase [soil metagenome]